MKIIPTKIILGYDGQIKVGKHVIGWWDTDYVAGSYHFRPSPNEGRRYYTAKLTNGDFLDAFSQKELREEIIAACKNGIEPEE